ncbi:SCY1-like protein 2 [Tachypleus tridentatus]|uniref:SCY1-like protein 2 n=1 Tax=Tachypleus tridentatus TaxID=6853 RepID=UPI003FD4EC8D
MRLIVSIPQIPVPPVTRESFMRDSSKSPVPCQSFTSKLPKLSQPDLDYTAPEVQASSCCSPHTDMFSLGLVICALFNNGRSLIEANLNTVHYDKVVGTPKTILSQIPRKLWFQHVLPSLKSELQSPEVLSAALQPLLYIIKESTLDEYQTLILPMFRSVFSMPKSVQATVTLLENLDVIMKKTSKSDVETCVLQMMYNAFDSATPQIQCAALHAVTEVADHLDEAAVRKMILPRTKQAFEQNSDVKVQANALTCVETIIDKLEKSDILDEVLPMLNKAKLHDPTVLMPAIRIYKHMLGDKRYGLTVNLLSTKVMPALIPIVVCPGLKLDQFNSLVELLQEMLHHVARNQRNKLKLEKTSIPSSEKLSVPSTIDQTSGYPHRPPLLRLESRRTSVSMEDVVRRTMSPSPSPDSNLLTVQVNLPGRRHSDNTIHPPRIMVAPCSPDSPSSPSSTTPGVQMRRHSSVSPHDTRYNFSSPKSSSNLGTDLLTGTQVPPRRFSAVALYNTIGGSTSSSSNQTPSLLQQIGSSVQQLFSGK